MLQWQASNVSGNVMVWSIGDRKQTRSLSTRFQDMALKIFTPPDKALTDLWEISNAASPF